MKKILVTLLIVSLLAFPVMAGVATNFEQISVTSGAVKTFTANLVQDTTKSPANAKAAYCTLETGPIRYTMDGTTPTADVGHLMAVATSFALYGYQDISSFKAIAVSTTGVLSCTYFFTLEVH